MSAHTAGPWTLIAGAHCPIVQRGRAGGCQIKGDDPNVELADARLIAAAPELLRALNDLREQVESLEGFQLTRDIEQYKALANWDFAIAQADFALAAATHAPAPPSP